MVPSFAFDPIIDSKCCAEELPQDPPLGPLVSGTFVSQGMHAETLLEKAPAPSGRKGRGSITPHSFLFTDGVVVGQCEDHTQNDSIPGGCGFGCCARSCGSVLGIRADRDSSPGAEAYLRRHKPRGRVPVLIERCRDRAARVFAHRRPVFFGAVSGGAGRCERPSGRAA